jgi:hypothetical protein
MKKAAATSGMITNFAEELSLKAVVALVGVPEGLRMPRARPLQSARRANEQAKMKTTDYQEREMKQERFCVGSG